MGRKARNLNLVVPLWDPSWAYPEALWGCLGGLLGRLGPFLGRLGALLGASWAVLGASWAVVDAVNTQEANMLKIYVFRKEWDDFCFLWPSWVAS